MAACGPGEHGPELPRCKANAWRCGWRESTQRPRVLMLDGSWVGGGPKIARIEVRSLGVNTRTRLELFQRRPAEAPPESESLGRVFEWDYARAPYFSPIVLPCSNPSRSGDGHQGWPRSLFVND